MLGEPALSLRAAVAKFEAQFICDALRRHPNKAIAAVVLGIPIRTLHYKIRRYGIVGHEIPPEDPRFVTEELNDRWYIQRKLKSGAKKVVAICRSQEEHDRTLERLRSGS